MPIAFLNRARGSGSRAFDSDVLSWRDSVVANGGSVSLARLIVVDQFVFSEKASGTWALTDDYWGFWAENAIQALTSLKQRRLATAVNSPTFTTDRGYAGDGVTSYINLVFDCSVDGINCTGTNQRIGGYERTNVASGGATVSVVNSSTQALTLVNRSAVGTTAIGRQNFANASFTLSPQDSRGLKASSRAGGGTASLMYDRGVRLTDVTGLTVGSAAPTGALYAMAQNNGGAANGFRPCSLGFVVVGGSLASDAREAAQSANVQGWATSVGANV